MVTLNKLALSTPTTKTAATAGKTSPIGRWNNFGRGIPLPNPLPLGGGPGERDITKWDIFHYVYALLHHPTYHTTYAANLRRELPRIPFAEDFWGFATAGARLAELHVNYEQQPEYPLKFIENPDEPLNWRVEKMRLSKDKTQIKYNNFLTLAGIPPEVFEYRLGNRSALDWVIDQYQVRPTRAVALSTIPTILTMSSLWCGSLAR